MVTENKIAMLLFPFCWSPCFSLSRCTTAANSETADFIPTAKEFKKHSLYTGISYIAPIGDYNIRRDFYG